MSKASKDERQKELEKEEANRINELRKNRMYSPVDIIREKTRGIARIQQKLAEEFPIKK